MSMTMTDKELDLFIEGDHPALAHLAQTLHDLRGLDGLILFTEANFMALIRSAEGTPYLFGGIDPFHGGADCSGLIYWAALQCGVILPRTTEAEWADLPHSTNWGAAPIGSIVEFEVPADGGAPPQHVGVVVGGGFMIDDPHTGTVVKQEAIPNEPGVIWPTGFCTLPFVVTPPVPPPPPPAPKGEFMQTPVVSFRGGQIDVLQVSNGVLWHKWFTSPGPWNNENVIAAAGQSVTLAAVEPQFSQEVGLNLVTVEDTAGDVWVFQQPVGEGGWGANRLP